MRDSLNSTQSRCASELQFPSQGRWGTGIVEKGEGDAYPHTLSLC